MSGYFETDYLTMRMTRPVHGEGYFNPFGEEQEWSGATATYAAVAAVATTTLATPFFDQIKKKLQKFIQGKIDKWKENKKKKENKEKETLSIGSYKGFFRIFYQHRYLNIYILILHFTH